MNGSRREVGAMGRKGNGRAARTGSMRKSGCRRMWKRWLLVCAGDRFAMEEKNRWEREAMMRARARRRWHASNNISAIGVNSGGRRARWWILDKDERNDGWAWRGGAGR